jgi:class II lanthipeptide synthase
MDAFYKRLIVGAATIDEILSDDFEPLPGQKGEADLAARRLAAWCNSSASGDWSLFDRRLKRDHLAMAQVLTRLSTVRRKASVPPPSWIDSAIWIEQALKNASSKPKAARDQAEPYAFEHLFLPLVERAEAQAWSGIDAKALDNLDESARTCLRHSLLKALTGLCAPALYERFIKARKANPPQDAGTSLYDQFVADMKAGGFRRLFEDKPVLLRLIATTVQQWTDTSREFILRLDADLAAIRRDVLRSGSATQVARIEGDISDPHNGGRSVRIVGFMDGLRVVYKPKDLRLDTAWHSLIDRLNEANPPVDLKAVRAIAREGYGWTEFIEHSGTDAEGCKRFFRRAGASLALFHCFAAADMHQENMIASGEHPVPIDLETILHATPQHGAPDPEQQAAEAARDVLANSVMAVGLLPAYGRSPFNDVFAIGGLTSGWTSKTTIAWTNINTDAMRPTRSKDAGTSNPNLPHVGGGYARFAEHIEDFVSGFADYAKFLARLSRDVKLGGLFDGFAGIPVRKVIRPTRFYYMLLQRLKNHQSMDDGVTWSAQADFIARLADWEKDVDPFWPLQRAERAALLALNVPHFVSPSDGNEISDAAGVSVHTPATSGMERARARVRSLDEPEIAWQIEVIRENTNSASPATRRAKLVDTAAVPTRDVFVAEAGRIAAELSDRAIRRGPGAAWIGLDWLGDADVFQLTCLGPDLYNGASGIALFLAAHASVTGSKPSGELALAAIADIRKNLKSRNAARIARSLGAGGATGLGSIVYAFAAISKCLHDDDLLAEAHAAADLFTDDLIAADKQLDVLGGSAGAILCLLRLYRDSRSEAVLRHAEKCGEHLLAQGRLGAEGRRSWVGQGVGSRALNGMSHGAAGFAYALASLAAATGRDDFTQAASECVAYEDSSYDATRHNWPDLRGAGEPSWPCQWCHGAPGIGLARIAAAKRGTMDAKLMADDITNAVAGVERTWPNSVDTLCCGTLGSVEFLCEAAEALSRGDLRELAARRLLAVLQAASASGDYRWNGGKRRFNLGLFRGLAGVGYTALRQADGALPNVLIWE